MARTDLPLPQVRAFTQTSRVDRWWLQPLLTFLGLFAFIVYGTWAAWQGDNYGSHAGAASVGVFGGGASIAHYLSPMYSPLLWDSPHWVDGAGNVVRTGHSWFGAWPSWIPAAIAFMPITPAFLILWMPGGFRFTCYYYRGAYYKAFWQDPTSCAVGEPGFRGTKYRGERWFPLVLQNVHRYFLYLAILFIFILTYDAIVSYIFTDPATGSKSFGIGVGSLVLTINPILLGGYTFGCHSLRHLVAGRFDLMSKHPGRKKAYDCVSCLNRKHMLWAWLSLFWVGFTDVYVRLTAAGVWVDYRLV
ncbi:MAG: succinate dehydrogenase [Phycisphaeraceae bacterium]|nr:MAG: succinate dehydrogenase [Phycisphaeraceae bacterium]